MDYVDQGQAQSISADRNGVIWTPMDYFYIGENKCTEIRLSFSYCTLSEIAEGVKRLAGMVRDRIQQGAPVLGDRHARLVPGRAALT